MRQSLPRVCGLEDFNDGDQAALLDFTVEKCEHLSLQLNETHT